MGRAEPRKRQDSRQWFRGWVLLEGLGVSRERLEGLEDWPIAGASTEITVEVLLDFGRSRRCVAALGEQGVGVHHPARCAKPALGAVGLRMERTKLR